MTALATEQDVERLLGRALTSDEAARVIPGLLSEASDTVRGHLFPSGVGTPIPEAVSTVVARMVIRALRVDPNADAGLTSHQWTAGPYQGTETYDVDSRSGGVWLTAQDKLRLRPFKAGGRAVSVATW